MGPWDVSPAQGEESFGRRRELPRKTRRMWRELWFSRVHFAGKPQDLMGKTLNVPVILQRQWEIYTYALRKFNLVLENQHV